VFSARDPGGYAEEPTVILDGAQREMMRPTGLFCHQGFQIGE
jgi:hypothetical protein